MRTGNDLVQATKPYVAEDRRKSWTSFAAISLIVLSVLVAIALVPLTGPSGIALKFGLGTLLGLLQIRLFIFYHDYLHGALLRRSKRAEVLMAMVGAYMLSVRSVWRETHNYHHKNNAKMIGSAIGSFPLVTTKIWARMDRRQRLLYKTVRHPLFIFGGYFTVFLLGMSLPPYKRDPEKHRGAPLAVLAHVLIAVALGVLLDPWTAVAMWVWPNVVSMGLGSYLFYAQHNFPDIEIRGRREWDYTHAALRSSSMFDMGPVMHWLTGNIGYHHIHHLNHRIPFYRLPEAYAGVEELRSPGRTSWSPKDIVACLRCNLWDPDAQRMVTFREAEATMPAAVAEAA
jgi:omega-6 fatty acid desaturase (delta-12 desaturase)